MSDLQVATKNSTLVLGKIVIESRASDNFINATQLCKAGKKKFNHWIVLDSTKELIKELETTLKSDAGITASQNIKLIDIKKGNSKNYSQGSWIHPDLAVQLAQWISPKFAIQVSRWIRELMLTGTTTINSKKSDKELIELQNQLKEKDQLLQTKDTQIAKLEKKQLALTSFVNNIKRLENNQLFYIMTTKNYARQNRFEYGGVKDIKEIKNRIATYNTGRAEGDLMFVVNLFKCNSYKAIEDRVGHILQNFKDKPAGRKEMVHLRYNRLLEVVQFIVENIDREIEYINACCKQFLDETLDLDPIELIELDVDGFATENDMQIVVRRRGKEQIHKIDISSWDDNKVHQKIEEIINLCASEKKKVEYDFSTQKDSVALELSWTLLTPYLKTYDLTMTIWRNQFKKWLTKEKPKQLKIKGIKC